jgi:hypothetical protein
MSYCNELKKCIIVSHRQVTVQGTDGVQEFDTPQCLDKRQHLPPPNSLSDVADNELYTANRIKWILRTLIMNEKFISRSVRQDDKTKLEISLSRHCREVR